jgi:hypothetical protein
MALLAALELSEYIMRLMPTCHVQAAGVTAVVSIGNAWEHVYY